MTQAWAIKGPDGGYVFVSFKSENHAWEQAAIESLYYDAGAMKAAGFVCEVGTFALCGSDYTTVRREAIDWLKKHYPVLCVKSGLCEEIGGRLYTKTSTCVPATVVEGSAEPIDMLLDCPRCHLRHVDAPDDRTPGWTNPPHKSHLCHGCGLIWRVSDTPTNGVSALTSGKDAPPADDARRLLERAYTVMDELCTALDNAEADIGGSRPIKDIYADIGPITEEIEVHLARSET